MADPVEQHSQELRRCVAGWASLWNLPGLEDRVTVTFSTRFRTSLGRCAPTSGEIRLAAFLQNGADELLTEALCHEVAHAAAHELHGHRLKPHGPEWRALMETAGFEARARIPAALLQGVTPPDARQRALWEHRCPVCHATRLARTAVRRWRCASCTEAGLSGQLIVTKLEAGGGEGR